MPKSDIPATTRRWLVAITDEIERIAGGQRWHDKYDGVDGAFRVHTMYDKRVSEAYPDLAIVAYPLPPGVAAGDGDLVKCSSDDFDALVMQNARVFKAGNFSSD